MMPFSVAIKPGCRGDPRMNRAVAAKLANPTISLFEALRLGGFNYPENVDAATMDNDMVTLGQRKNQLNRRLRTARKRHKSHMDSAASLQDTDVDEAKPAAHPDLHGSMGTKRSLEQDSAASPNKAMRLSQASVTTNDLNGDVNCQATSANLVSEPDSNDAQIQQAVSEQELSLLNSLNGGSSAAPSSGFPPHLQILSQSFAAAATGAAHNDFQSHDGLDHGRSTLGKSSSGSSTDFLSAVLWQQQTNRNNDELFGGTRQSNLNESTPFNPLRQEGRYEAASRFFSNELLGLYQRCMVRAGYTIEEASPSSHLYRRFAFDAWKAECERLQRMLATDPVPQHEACLPQLSSGCDISVDMLRAFHNEMSGAGNRV